MRSEARRNSIWIPRRCLVAAETSHGLLIRGEGTGTRQVEVDFLSREAGNAGAQPRLMVNYTPAAGPVGQGGALLRPRTWLPLLAR